MGVLSFHLRTGKLKETYDNDTEQKRTNKRIFIHIAIC